MEGIPIAISGGVDIYKVPGCHLLRQMIFLSSFLDVTRISMSTVSFLTQLDSGILSIECFPLTYDLLGFKSRINRHLLTAGSFETDCLYAACCFLYALIFLYFFSCNSKPRSGCSALYGVNPNLKKRQVFLSGILLPYICIYLEINIRRPWGIIVVFIRGKNKPIIEERR